MSYQNRRRNRRKAKRISNMVVFALVSTSLLTVNNAKAQKLQMIEGLQKENDALEKENSKKSYSYDAKKINKKLTTYDYSNEEKIVFLTFDDGPSLKTTPDILNILEKHDVKATFFVIGELLEESKTHDLIKDMYKSGHSIANHTYTHDYKVLYPNGKMDIENNIKEIEKTDKALKNILGEDFNTRVFRCPGGYESWNGMDKLKEYLDKTNRVYVDWNVTNGDTEYRGTLKQDQLYKRATESSKDKDIVVILMHDSNSKSETVKSLENVIKYYKEKGYSFKTLV